MFRGSVRSSFFFGGVAGEPGNTVFLLILQFRSLRFYYRVILRLEDLNDSWKDKAFYKRCATFQKDVRVHMWAGLRCTPFIPQRDAEEYRRICLRLRILNQLEAAMSRP